MRPDYCLFEAFDGGCRACSLSSYGLDCMNNKIMDNDESDDDDEAEG